jgi:hypothetical protein
MLSMYITIGILLVASSGCNKGEIHQVASPSASAQPSSRAKVSSPTTFASLASPPVVAPSGAAPVAKPASTMPAVSADREESLSEALSKAKAGKDESDRPKCRACISQSCKKQIQVCEKGKRMPRAEGPKAVLAGKTSCQAYRFSIDACYRRYPEEKDAAHQIACSEGAVYALGDEELAVGDSEMLDACIREECGIPCQAPL